MVHTAAVAADNNNKKKKKKKKSDDCWVRTNYWLIAKFVQPDNNKAPIDRPLATLYCTALNASNVEE